MSNTEEITLTYNENGILNWNTSEGIIVGLKSEHFKVQVEGEATTEQKNEAKKQFFLYMVEFKKAKAIAKQAEADALILSATVYAKKADNVGKELTEAEKLIARKARLMAQLEAINAQGEELGIEV